MIRTLHEVSDLSLTSLSYAARPYAADTLTESQLPSREVTDDERELFDDLEDHYEKEGNKKLKDKVGNKPKKKEEDPFADTPDDGGDAGGDDAGGEDDLDMEDF